MKFFYLVSCLALISCSSWNSPFGKKIVRNSKSSYSLQDVSGKYRATREIIFKDHESKLLSKFVIKDKVSNQDLEKSLSYSVVKGDKVKPVLAQHSTWLEKKKFFSQIKYNKENKNYEVYLKTPEKKWSGRKAIKVPDGKFTCFLTQLPECLHLNGIMRLFKQDPEVEIDIIVIWDNYPFYAEQYIGLKEELYSLATLRIDGLQNDKIRVALEIQGQIIFYLFDKNLNYLNTYWVVQGYRLEKNVITEGK